MKSFFYKLATSKKKLNEFIRFLFLGSLATLTHLICLSTLIENQLCNEIIANIISYIVGLKVSYWGHKKFTFRYTGHKKDTTLFSLFMIPSIAGFSVNQIIFITIIQFAHYFIAFLCAGILTAITTYSLNKLIVFKEK